MRKLILVKHSAVVVQPDVPAAQWRLSDVGRARCVSLARMLAEYAPTVIVASDEPKAVETADTVAGGSGCRWRPRPAYGSTTGPTCHITEMGLSSSGPTQSTGSQRPSANCWRGAPRAMSSWSPTGP